MMQSTRLKGGVLGAGLIGALAFGSPAQATYFGLDVGDEIDTVGFTIDSPNGVFNDVTDELDIVAEADDITTTTAAVLGEINGGPITVGMDLASEQLVHDGFGFFTYTAAFTGRLGGADITLTAPVNASLPEAGGQLLMSGNFLVTNLALEIEFAPAFSIFGTPVFTGTFNVIGGDSAFLDVFGSQGTLANVLASGTTSSPPTSALLADGFLFSVRDTNLAACAAQAANTLCLASIVANTGSFNFSGTGELEPLSAAPFVPEPSTALLLGFGMVGLLGAARRAGRK